MSTIHESPSRLAQVASDEVQVINTRRTGVAAAAPQAPIARRQSKRRAVVDDDSDGGLGAAHDLRAKSRR